MVDQAAGGKPKQPVISDPPHGRMTKSLERQQIVDKSQRLLAWRWRNTGNLVSLDDVDEVGRWLDEVPVDGRLGGEPGAVGLAHDAWVMPAAAFVEPFQQFGAGFAGGAA
jgi:hypothetical protein